jgi:hypothetical protein
VAFGSHPSWVTSDAAVVNSYLNHAAYSTAATPCSQSQIGRDPHLRSRGTEQAEAAVALSVVVRSGPVRTAVNGTVVARPARKTWHNVAPLVLP